MGKINQQQFDESFNALINQVHDSSYEIHTKSVKEGSEVIVVFKKPNFLWRIVRWLLYRSYHDYQGAEKAIKFISANFDMFKSSVMPTIKNFKKHQMYNSPSRSLQLHKLFSHLFQRMKKKPRDASIHNKKFSANQTQ